MKSPKFQQEERLFDEAVRIQCPTARQEYLAQACGSDDQLLNRIKQLLQLNQTEGLFIDDSTFAESFLEESLPAIESIGDTISNYSLVEKIGEGGMGVVYKATQTQPVRRDVALKILKLIGDSGNIVRRFEVERQSLAIMDHPNITKVIDGGLTESDRPFFVMEYVQGQNISDYCGDSKMSLEDRLIMFQDVCRGIHHAHLRGIIHRDIKPANVLVANVDGVSTPKIIDFGIARVLDHDPEATLQTLQGQLLGTLEYMSPEQADPGRGTIDTRSDVYSLGALLYNLLTGVAPIEQSAQAGVLQMLDKIRSTEPDKPSVNPNAATMPFSADLLKGELDWITLKALEREPDQRYQSAKALCEDIERYLQGEPVHAAEPTFWYRARKAYRKHTGAFLLSGFIALLLLVMAIGGTLLAWNAHQSRQLAEKRLEEVSEAQKKEQQLRQTAEKERDRARAAEAQTRVLIRERQLRLVNSESINGIYESRVINDWLDEIFDREEDPSNTNEPRILKLLLLKTIPFNSPFVKLDETRISRELEEAMPFLSSETIDDVEPVDGVEFVEVDIGEAHDVHRIIMLAVEIRQQKLLELMPKDDPTIADSYELLSLLQMSEGMLDEAEKGLLEGLKVRTANMHIMPTQEADLARLRTLGILGICQQQQGQFVEGRRRIDELLNTPVSNNAQFERFRQEVRKFMISEETQPN